MTSVFRRLAVCATAALTVLSLAHPALAQSGNQVSNQDEGIGIGVLAGLAKPDLSVSGVVGDVTSGKTGTMLGFWVGGNRGGLIGFTGEFNYSTANNLGASRASGELLLFLNNDIEVLDDDWLSELAGWAERPEVGLVGCKLIRPDGTITMPLVGDLPARGKTPSQLRDVIKAALQNFLKLQAGNEVTVSVKTYNSYAFTVNGEVSRPGLYTSTKYLRAADAIALAGGPTRFAKRGDIRILRLDSKGEQISIPIDFDLVASGKRPDMNVWIQSNDVVWVP